MTLIKRSRRLIMKKEQIRKTVARQFERGNNWWRFNGQFYVCRMYFNVQNISLSLSLTNFGDRIVLDDMRLRMFQKHSVSSPKDSAEFCGDNFSDQIIDWITDYIFRLNEQFADVFRSLDELRAEQILSACQQIAQILN